MNVTSKNESTMKTHDNTIITTSNQTTLARLTQYHKQPNFTGNRAHQTIYREIQVSCKMKNDMQAREYNEKKMTTQ
jgi:hypothetical protein